MTTPMDESDIATVDQSGPRILADGLHFTNEIRFDEQEEEWDRRVY
jgi:hypothetical protein